MEVVDEATSRPVIRCMDRGFILTRIDPAQKETSMLVRIRPGWDDLRAQILGQNPRCACKLLSFITPTWMHCLPSRPVLVEQDAHHR